MKRILIIEDDESIADMYKMKFELSGFVPVVAEDGERGLELAKSEKPDLILLDLVLPHMDGYAVLKNLKNDEETKNIKVYIISNLGQGCKIEDKDLCPEADGYLVKSNLTPSQLVATVKNILDEKTMENKKTDLKTKDRPEEIKSGSLARVLLIEDEEVLAEMYQLSLGKAGFRVDLARNGAWGVKLANGEKFDIIILDMLMPAMHGHEAIEKLKTDDRTKHIPVVVLSNSAQDEDIDKAKRLGVAAYLLKAHVTPSKVVGEIKKILKII